MAPLTCNMSSTLAHWHNNATVAETIKEVWMLTMASEVPLYSMHTYMQIVYLPGRRANKWREMKCLTSRGTGTMSGGLLRRLKQNYLPRNFTVMLHSSLLREDSWICNIHNWCINHVSLLVLLSQNYWPNSSIRTPSQTFTSPELTDNWMDWWIERLNDGQMAAKSFCSDRHGHVLANSCIQTIFRFPLGGREG